MGKGANRFSSITDSFLGHRKILMSIVFKKATTMNSHGFSIFPLPLPITNNVRYSTSEKGFVFSV